MKPTGYILYDGPSLLDGLPIVVIATGYGRASKNPKTGNMIQTWILRSDIPPVEAVETREDYSVCGNCYHRGDPQTGRARSCYVKVWQAPRAIYAAYRRGRYPRAETSQLQRSLGTNRAIRVGSYGDPAAVPVRVWQAITADSKGWTGYTHQWNLPGINRQALQRYCMASVDTPEERQQARAMGWRTFRVTPKGTLPGHGEISCPASKEAGQRTTCAKCKLCAGTSVNARVSVAINLH